MTAKIISFPRLGPFAVSVQREADGDGWMVVCRSHGWLHGLLDAAVADAREIARGHGVSVVIHQDVRSKVADA